MPTRSLVMQVKIHQADADH